MSQLLPTGYEKLEPFVEFWAVEGTAERDKRRGESTVAQRKAFFETAKDMIPGILAELDKKPRREFDEREKRLFQLALSFPHVSMAVEMLGDAEPRHTVFRNEMVVKRWPADI